ncbi:SIR2-like domain-containing protein [Geodermatophilus obscurus]|uniref:SIR2-like domain-containing protein n=2 Tax=Geodermatophilus obscurus TaxID=1861 RepID=A0A1M7T6F8_9ACTN|nr:SIR2-like domain-containing protein [Geodermatophilus obscurus]
MTVLTGPRSAVDEYADLEIGLHRRDAVTWTVELRFFLPRTDFETQLDVSGPLLAHIDPRELDAIDDEEEYGLTLGSGLFGHGLGAAFQTAVATSQSQGVRLRVRLVMGSGAAALHGLRWETLRNPTDRSRLLTNENVLFSRYLSSQDWRPVGVRPRGDLRALAVVAGPSDLDSIDAGRPLAPVRVDEELARAREGLSSLLLTTLPGSAAPTAATLLDRVHRGVDVLYLVCHGYVARDEPVLLLVDEDGHAAPLLASELISQLRDLPRLPRLVFLASCQSAGAGADRRSEDAGVLAALGPRLAEAGVPAVVAMQGNITMATSAAFTKAFFDSLDADGLVDRATAVARAAVRDRPDWWVPALFMRLKSGRLWYQPGTTPGGERFDKWPSLVTDFKVGMCTPVIGPGITDTLLGTRQEMAREWAQSYRFPMAPHNRESLPEVAQYLSVNQNRSYPRLQLASDLRRTLMERYRDDLPADLPREDASLEDLIAGAWSARHRREEVDPFSVLAQLSAPVYITTVYTRLLARALTDAGRRPEVELCRWHEDADWPESVFDREPGYRPTPERPLIYHLHGTFDEPQSLVLTEDDYFDFLSSVTRNQDVVPKVVRRRLSDSALMFVGFRLDQWDFRALYRNLMRSEGGRRHIEYTHVAVQNDPEEDDATIDAGRARQYLESYFRNADVSLYWGSTEHFFRELNDASGRGEPAYKPSVRRLELAGRSRDSRDKRQLVTTSPGHHRVFLCHSSGDKEQVRDLYHRLTQDGVPCWFDEEDLLPGQDWEREITKALADCRYVLACLSNASLTKAGYVQKELKRALDLADEQPEGSIFLIPVRLETCEVPDRLKRLQWADLFLPGAYERLLKSLERG